MGKNACQSGRLNQWPIMSVEHIWPNYPEWDTQIIRMNHLNMTTQSGRGKIHTIVVNCHCDNVYIVSSNYRYCHYLVAVVLLIKTKNTLTNKLHTTTTKTTTTGLAAVCLQTEQDTGATCCIVCARTHLPSMNNDSVCSVRPVHAQWWVHK